MNISGKNKRILYVIPSLSVGGAELQTINQINYLKGIGVPTKLVVLSKKKILLSSLQIDKDSVSILGFDELLTLTSKSLAKVFPAIKKIEAIIDKYEPSHILAILPISQFIMRLVKGKRNYLGQLWCYHRSMQYDANPLDSISKKIFHRINTILSNRYDYGHIFISHAVKKNIKEFLQTRNDVVIYNALPSKSIGIDLALDYIEHNNISSNKYIVIPGRLHSVKGQEFFIEATKKFFSQSYLSHDTKVIIAGGGDRDIHIKKLLSDYSISHYYHVTGHIENNLLLSFLKLATLVVIPSTFEGFGNTAVESLMQGATILASNTGGLPEIIQDGQNGFLYECQNAISLLEKLKYILGNNICLDSDFLERDYQSRFTLDNQMTKLLSVLED